ncbi:MAG: hypothetical protein CSB48_02910 [Proteobacteria bacterium]|nr:MAG: hypothetical protein CSB48_02910 [Pseudomonadota bacterium]
MIAFQNNDIQLEISITDQKTAEAINYASITGATYVIATLDRATVLLTKDIGDGIVIAGDRVIVSLDQADTVQLNTVYYHELQIAAGGKHSTVVSDNITFRETAI